MVIPKDYLDQDLKAGDAVVFTELKYRNFTTGILISDKAPTGGTILAEHTYHKGKIDKYKQSYDQMIKITDPAKIAEVKNFISKLKGAEEYAKVLFSS